MNLTVLNTLDTNRLETPAFLSGVKSMAPLMPCARLPHQVHHVREYTIRRSGLGKSEEVGRTSQRT